MRRENECEEMTGNCRGKKSKGRKGREKDVKVGETEWKQRSRGGSPGMCLQGRMD